MVRDINVGEANGLRMAIGESSFAWIEGNEG
jgi:hypothetical protein